jgi:hypothetical protein
MKPARWIGRHAAALGEGLIFGALNSMNLSRTWRRTTGGKISRSK